MYWKLADINKIKVDKLKAKTNNALILSIKDLCILSIFAIHGTRFDDKYVKIFLLIENRYVAELQDLIKNLSNYILNTILEKLENLVNSEDKIKESKLIIYNKLSKLLYKNNEKIEKEDNKENEEAINNEIEKNISNIILEINNIFNFIVSFITIIINDLNDKQSYIVKSKNLISIDLNKNDILNIILNILSSFIKNISEIEITNNFSKSLFNINILEKITTKKTVLVLTILENKIDNSYLNKIIINKNAKKDILKPKISNILNTSTKNKLLDVKLNKNIILNSDSKNTIANINKVKINKLQNNNKDLKSNSILQQVLKDSNSGIKIVLFDDTQLSNINTNILLFDTLLNSINLKINLISSSIYNLVINKNDLILKKQLISSYLLVSLKLNILLLIKYNFINNFLPVNNINLLVINTVLYFKHKINNIFIFFSLLSNSQNILAVNLLLPLNIKSKASTKQNSLNIIQNSLLDGINKKLQKIDKSSTNLFKFFKDTLTEHISGLEKIYKELTKGIITKIIEWLINMVLLKILFSFIKPIIKLLFIDKFPEIYLLHELLDKLKKAVTEPIKKAFDKVKRMLTKPFRAMKKLFSKLLKSFMAVIKKLVNGLLKLVKKLIGLIINGIKKAIKLMTEFLRKAASLLTKFFQKAKNAIGNLFPKIKNVVNNFKNGIKNGFSKVLNGIKSGFNKFIGKPLKNLGKGLSNAVKSLGSKVGKGFNFISKSVKGFTGLFGKGSGKGGGKIFSKLGKLAGKAGKLGKLVGKVGGKFLKNLGKFAGAILLIMNIKDLFNPETRAKFLREAAFVLWDLTKKIIIKFVKKKLGMWLGLLLGSTVLAVFLPPLPMILTLVYWGINVLSLYYDILAPICDMLYPNDPKMVAIQKLLDFILNSVIGLLKVVWEKIKEAAKALFNFIWKCLRLIALAIAMVGYKLRKWFTFGLAKDPFDKYREVKKRKEESKKAAMDRYAHRIGEVRYKEYSFGWFFTIKVPYYTITKPMSEVLKERLVEIDKRADRLIELNKWLAENNNRLDEELFNKYIGINCGLTDALLEKDWWIVNELWNEMSYIGIFDPDRFKDKESIEKLKNEIYAKLQAYIPLMENENKLEEIHDLFHQKVDLIEENKEAFESLLEDLEMLNEELDSAIDEEPADIVDYDNESEESDEADEYDGEVDIDYATDYQDLKI